MTAGNGDILAELRRMVEEEIVNERPAIRMILTSQISVIGGIRDLKKEILEHKHAGLETAVEMLGKQQSAGDKLARTVAIVGGVLAVTATLVAFVK